MNKERGYLLLAILPLAMLVGGFVLMTTTTARAYLDEHEVRRYQTAALNEANAALATAQARIKASTYTNDFNDLIQNTLADGEDVELNNAEGNPYRVLSINETSEVWISELSQGWYQVDAIARVGGRRTHVRTLVRERDPFSRFGAFVNSHPLGIAGSPKGDIHTNQKLQLFFADGDYDDYVSASDGFQWLIGANWGNTTFGGGYDDAHETISMPTVASIQNLEPYSDGALDSLLGARDPDDYDITLTLNGDSYTLEAREKSGPEVLQAPGLAFPADGVIYIDADLAGLGGTLDARVTIACTGEITITDNIRYVDSNGEAIYLNGLTTDPDDDPYIPNPDYDGNAALGVIANGDILYSHDIPDYLEINGAFFSATGRYGLPGLSFTSDGLWCTGYDSSFQKQSFRRLGGLTTDLRIVSTVVNGSGTVLSGFQEGTSVFDVRLRSEPPPHYLAIDRPLFNGYRIVSGGIAGTESGEGDGFNITDKPVGAKEREINEVTQG